MLPNQNQGQTFELIVNPVWDISGSTRLWLTVADGDDVLKMLETVGRRLGESEESINKQLKYFTILLQDEKGQC